VMIETELHKRPNISVNEWEIELLRALSGGRDAAIEHLGSISEHVRVKIVNSADPSETESMFHEGLRRLVGRWQWRPIANLRETAMMLDLLYEFIPPGGGTKTIELLREWPPGDAELDDGAASKTDVRLLALDVLSKYFLMPKDRSSERRAYATLLHDFVMRQQYTAHALARLLEIHSVTTKEMRVVLENRSLVADVVHEIVEFQSVTAVQREELDQERQD